MEAPRLQLLQQAYLNAAADFRTAGMVPVCGNLGAAWCDAVTPAGSCHRLLPRSGLGFEE
jgi:hypothetical protein